MSRSVLILILLLAGSCTSSDYYRSKLSSILGTEVEVEDVTYYYDQSGIVSSDGYTLTIFLLTRETIDRFLVDQTKLEYPVNFKDGGDWNSTTWTKGSLSAEFKEIKSIILDYYTDDAKQKEMLKNIERLLQSESIYYASFYRGELEYPDAVLFFLLDPSNATIYIFDIAI